MGLDYIISLLVLALSVTGLSKLYAYLIHPNNLFGFVQKWLVWLKDRSEFTYRSIGGCNVCTTQRFADIFFILHSLYFSTFVWYWYIVVYILFGGLVFFLSGIFDKKNIPTPETITKKIEL